MVISPQALGERIELAREAASRTQAELAAAVGVDRTAISKITWGTRQLSALELAAVAKFLGRPLGWFLSDSPATKRAVICGHANEVNPSVTDA